MLVKSLPHRGRNIVILADGGLIIFDCAVGVSEAQEGAGARIVRLEPQPGVFDAITAMLRANRDSRPEGNRGVYRLEVTPSVAANLRASNAYGLTALMLHTERDGATECVDIPLNFRGGTDHESTWRGTYGVLYIRVSPKFERDVTLVEVTPPAA